MPPHPKVTPFVLCILDGWGNAPDGPGNAITRAATPHWKRFHDEGVVAALDASGEAVGLPPGQMGNSEVGHLNIGAGRIVFQDIVRIDRDIRTGAFGDHEGLNRTMEAVKKRDATLHLAGLIGPGGVHSHERHMDALIQMAARHGFDSVQVHAILDGRDTPPQSAAGYLAHLQETLTRTQAGQVATVQGRYWAMDRDTRWERTERAYRVLVHQEGHRAANAQAGLVAAYARGQTDEFVEPTVLDGARPVAPRDGFILVNFRPDRARQITRALAEPGFDAFATERLDLDYVCMTRYQSDFERFATIAYPPDWPTGTLGEHLSRLGLRQLRAAETEKYAHVTYFFSGGREQPFDREQRILIPSSKVATYDLQPEMRARELTDRLVEVLRDDPPHLIVVNYANPDMVGHTGILEATQRAIETIDHELGRLETAVRAAGGALLITADHGNAEAMLDDRGGPVTKHSTNPVPLLLLAGPGTLPPGTRLDDGILADVAPTVLDLMGLPIPPQMDRASLVRV